MTGKLTIDITEKSIEVTGSLLDSNMIDHVLIVNALMNAFELKGEDRMFACESLLMLDDSNRNDMIGKFIEALENVLNTMKEAKADEG